MSNKNPEPHPENLVPADRGPAGPKGPRQGKKCRPEDIPKPWPPMHVEEMLPGFAGTTLSYEDMKCFLEMYAHYGVITKACEEATKLGHKCTPYQISAARKNLPEFKEAFERCKEIAADRFESEVIRRAVDGWDEDVWYQGKKCGEKTVYSDRMLELLVKGTRPDKFKDRKELTGKDGGPMQLQVTSFLDATTDDLDKIDEGEYKDSSENSLTLPDNDSTI